MTATSEETLSLSLRIPAYDMHTPNPAPPCTNLIYFQVSRFLDAELEPRSVGFVCSKTRVWSTVAVYMLYIM